MGGWVEILREWDFVFEPPDVLAVVNIPPWLDVVARAVGGDVPVMAVWALVDGLHVAKAEGLLFGVGLGECECEIKFLTARASLPVGLREVLGWPVFAHGRVLNFRRWLPL